MAEENKGAEDGQVKLRLLPKGEFGGSPVWCVHVDDEDDNHVGILMYNRGDHWKFTCHTSANNEKEYDFYASGTDQALARLHEMLKNGEWKLDDEKTEEKMDKREETYRALATGTMDNLAAYSVTQDLLPCHVACVAWHLGKALFATADGNMDEIETLKPALFEMVENSIKEAKSQKDAVEASRGLLKDLPNLLKKAIVGVVAVGKAGSNDEGDDDDGSEHKPNPHHH